MNSWSASMASSQDQWLRELSYASKLTDEVGEMIAQSSEQPPSGLQTQRHMAAARRKMAILRTKLETLQSLLTALPSKQIITAREVNRRQDMLNNLTYKAGEMAPILNMSMAADREGLLGLKTKSDEVMEKANELDNHDLVDFQKQIMQEQDEELVKLEEVVVSTKHIALTINAELDLHTRLLENVDEHVDETESRLQRVQRKLALLKKNTKGSCSSLILMVITVVVLIFLIWVLLKY